MFADCFTLKLGDTTVKGRRLSLKEIRDNRAQINEGALDVDKCVEIIKSHVTLADGGAFDPYDLTPDQLRKLVGELVLPAEGRGIADFIGLLS